MLRLTSGYIGRLCRPRTIVQRSAVVTAGEARAITDAIHRENDQWRKEQDFIFSIITTVAKDGRHSRIIREQDTYVTLSFLGAEMEKLGYSVKRRVGEIEVSW